MTHPWGGESGRARKHVPAPFPSQSLSPALSLSPSPSRDATARMDPTGASNGEEGGEKLREVAGVSIPGQALAGRGAGG